MDFSEIIQNPLRLSAYIISIVGYLLFALASGVKRKNQLLIMQSSGNFLCAVAEGLTGLWSGLVQDLVNLIRNIFVLKKWMNTILAIVFIILGLGIGIFVFIYDFNNAHWWGILPVIATAEYSIIILIPNVKVPLIKASLMVSSTCWAVYGFGMNFLPTFAFNCLSFVLATTSLILYFVRKRKENKIPKEDENEEFDSKEEAI